MTTATAVYRSIMLEIERRRMALGWPMEKFSEYAGVPDRYYAKSLNPDAPGGRQAQWRTLQLIVDALFPGGFDIEIKARPGAVMTKDNLKAKLLQLRATTDPRSQRELMGTLGRSGGRQSGEVRRQQATKKKLRRALASHAARMRWNGQEHQQPVGVKRKSAKPRTAIQKQANKDVRAT